MPGLATIVEHSFGAGIAELDTDEQYLTVVRIDEEYMIGSLMDGAPQFLMIDEELPVFTPGEVTSLRLFEFLCRATGTSRAEFLDRLAEEGAWANKHPRYRVAVGRRVHSIVGEGTGPAVADFGAAGASFDAVIETWVTDSIVLSTMMDERRDSAMLFCDTARSFSTVTEERWSRGETGAFESRAMDARQPSTWIAARRADTLSREIGTISRTKRNAAVGLCQSR